MANNSQTGSTNVIKVPVSQGKPVTPPTGYTNNSGTWVNAGIWWIWNPKSPSSNAGGISGTAIGNSTFTGNNDEATQRWNAINTANQNKSASGANYGGFLSGSTATNVTNEDGTTTTMYNSDEGKVETYTDTSGSKINFAGYNGGSTPSATDTDSFFAKQQQQLAKASGTDNLSGFIIPWDKWGRFSVAYTNTQSIGNKMPYGVEWVGSPALINDNALIRFEQVAGKKHHTQLLNQRGDYSFRNTRKKLILTTDSSDKQLTSVGIKTNNSKKTISKNDLQQYGYTSETQYKGSDNSNEVEVQTDTNTNELYVEVVDTSKKLWKPANTSDIGIKWIDTYDNYDSSGKKLAPTEVAKQYTIKKDEEPTEIEIDITSNESDIDSTGSTAPTNNTTNEAEETTAKINDNSLKYTLESGWSKNPTKVQYWLYTKFNWARCGNYLIPSGAACVNSVPMGPKDKTAYNNLILNSKKEIEYAKGWVLRDWKDSGYATKKQYLSLPNQNSDVKSELLEPTTINLCNDENWKGLEQFSYKFTDFLYCKYYSWIPNNYLITLRRFPMPVGDNGMVPDQDTNRKFMTPVAKAVTWAGEVTGNNLEELSTLTTKLNWREIKADFNEIQGNEQGALDGSPFGGFAKFLGMVNAVTQKGGSFGAVSGWDEQRAKFDPYANGSYFNKIYGPVNVIHTVKARDRGMEFDHSISLNFHYDLKEIGGINEKAAMLDIIANVLALTTNNADFWGGANRYFPNKPAYPFLGDKQGFKSWYTGDVTGFMQAAGNQLSDTFSGLMDVLNEFLTNPVAALKKIGTSGAKLGMANAIRNKGVNRPGFLGFKALLAGSPVGEWHLTIGNPFNPFMSIGNLICTGATFSFNNTFGIDDFPTEMTVKITLEHGKPRDKGDIESMFNRGSGRLHYAYFGKEEAWNTASSTRDTKVNKWEFKKSKSTGSQGKGGNVIDTAISESKKLYSASSKESLHLAHKVAFF